MNFTSIQIVIVFIFFAISCAPRTSKNDFISQEKLADSVISKPDTALLPHLLEPPSLDETIKKTDSSEISTRFDVGMNSIREFNELDSVNRTYYSEFYLDTHKLKQQGIFEDHYCAGIWKYYDKRGRLFKQIDFETGEKQLFHGRTEPFDALFLTVKFKGDSILKSYFGEEFLKSNLQWDPGRSYYFSANNSGSWFERATEKPDKFRLSYFIKLDRRHKYSTIEFEIDRNWRFTADTKQLGLRKCKHNCSFKVDYASAIEIAKDEGLNIDDKKYFAYLSWVDPSKKSKGISEDYEFVVAEFVSREKKGGSKVINYFDAVVIDPWTGKVLRKTKFENIEHVHEYSSSSSGLIETE